MAIRFLPYPLFQAFKDDGTPLEGGKVYVYAAGTTNAITTWADFNKNSANTHPVILNSRGEAAIWFDSPAKIVLKDSNDVTIWTEDNIRPTTSQSLTGQYNLVENGSFELDGDGDGEPDSWTVQLYNSSTSSQSLDTSEVAHGAQSLKFQSTGDGGGTATSTFFNVLDGGEHTVAFTIKSTVADVRNVVEVHWYDKSQTFLSKTAVYDDNTTNPTSFTRKYFNATAPANATFGKLVLIGCHESDSTSGSTWFDDVISIKEGMFFSGATGEVTADASDLNNIDGLTVDLSGLTATASELNTMDGITATTAELNKLDGYTGTTGNLNNIDGLTVDLSGLTATASELNDIVDTGPRVLIEEKNISSATGAADFTTGIDNSYDVYLLEVNNLTPSTTDVKFKMQTSSDGGSTWDSGSSDYGWAYQGGPVENDVSNGDDSIVIENVGTSNVGELVARIYVHRPFTATKTLVEAIGSYISGNGYPRIFNSGGARMANAAVDGFRLLFDASNIDSGQIKLYGLR